MSARFRVLAALLALIALSAGTAERMIASLCDMGAETVAHAQAGSAADVPDAGHETTPNGEPSSCPLVPAGAVSCVGAAPFLAVSQPPLPLLPEAALVSLSQSDARDLLLAVSLLRPPRA